MRRLSKEEINSKISFLEIKKKKLLDEQLIQKYNVSDAKKTKNLKIFTGISKLIAPFCISSTLVFFAGCSSEIGFPFIRDKEVKSKCYSLKIDDEITTSEHYISNSYGTDYPKSQITLYSPWTYDRGSYERTITYYEIKELKDINVYTAILNSDYDYIFNNYEFISQKQEVANNFVEDNKSIEASIYILDENDNIYVVESSKRNLIETLLEIFFVLVVTDIVIMSIKDKIILEIRRKKAEYNNELKNMELINKRIKCVDLEIAKYKSKVKKYEK